MMRMQFRGMVDFNEQVDGRMEAELLRDLPGRFRDQQGVLARDEALRIPGYRQAGQSEDRTGLRDFKSAAVPFQPVKTLKELFGRKKTKPTPVRRPLIRRRRQRVP
jgi:hypothetical protein